MKREKRKLLKIYLLSLIASTFIMFIFLGVIKYFFIYRETKNNYNLTVKKIEKEKEEEEKIEKEKEMLKVDSEIESRILEKSMLKRPGEKVIRLID